MANTLLENLINPEVLADMISAELPAQLKFTALAPVEHSLQGNPGNTITVPVYKYIGDAVDVAEGEAITYEKLQTDSQKFTVKKAGIGVKLTDEAVLSGYGDPVGEATRQILMSIASKVDNDTLEAIKSTPLEVNDVPLGTELIDEIEATFNREDGLTGVIFFSPKDYREFRRNTMDDFTRASDLGDEVLVKGVLGEVLGWQIVQSAKIEDGEPVAVLPGALKTYLKRETQAERGRDMDHKLTKYNADKHYVVGLYDETRALRVNVRVNVADTGE